MLLRKGNVVCKTRQGLELRYMVEEYLELSDMSRKYVNQYINAAQEVLDIKEVIEKKRKLNIFYIISLGRWFDTMTLKKRLTNINGHREACERCENHLHKKIAEYTNVIAGDTNGERVEIFTSVFINYVKIYVDVMEEQIKLTKQFVMKIKQIETIDEDDDEFIEELKANMVKNEKRMKLIYEQIKEVWTSVPEEIEEIEKTEEKELNNEEVENANVESPGIE